MKPECSSSDIISGLPQDIIETILCLVPTRDAVRTSILSKKWRYSWTRIPKLVFNEQDMYKGKKLVEKCKLFSAIHHVLLMQRGPIFEFSLNMYADDTCADIDQIITYLLRKNTVEKLIFKLDVEDGDERLKLPLSFFSFLHLTHLHLEHCNLDHQQPTLNGFGQLTSLFLKNVDMSEKLISHVLSKSPLLKSFSLVIDDTEYEFSYIYSLAFICELFGYMPSIKHLFLDIEDLRISNVSHSCLPRLPTPLVHLKYAHFVGGCDLPFPVSLLRSSPNLEKLKLQRYHNRIENDMEAEYLDVCLKHLKELEVDFDTDIDEMEMELLKLILGRSPMLNVVNIGMNSTIGNHAEILRALSNIPRASHMVEIVVKCTSFY